MKVLLVTGFENYFLEQDTLPALASRGVEVVDRFPASHVENIDLARHKADGVTMILHMHEFGAHNASEKLSRAARLVGLPIKALSRKKASWTFLPPPASVDPPDLEVNVNEAEEVDLPPIETIDDLADALIAYAAKGLYAQLTGDPLGDALIPKPVRQHMIEVSFDRKQARLRDVVQLIIAHGITEPERVVKLALDGRQQGIFPRLARVKPGDLPKLAQSMLEQELATLRAEKDEGQIRAVRMYQEDRDAIEGLGLVAPFNGVSHVDLKPKEEAMNGKTALGNGAIMKAVEPVNNPRDIRAGMVSFARVCIGVRAAPGAESFLKFLTIAKGAGLTIDDVIEALGE